MLESATGMTGIAEPLLRDYAQASPAAAVADELTRPAGNGTDIDAAAQDMALAQISMMRDEASAAMDEAVRNGDPEAQAAASAALSQCKSIASEVRGGKMNANAIAQKLSTLRTTVDMVAHEAGDGGEEAEKKNERYAAVVESGVKKAAPSFFASKPDKKGSVTCESEDEYQARMREENASKATNGTANIEKTDDNARQLDAEAAESRKDARNSDGTVSAREVLHGGRQILRAMNSEKKRATAAKTIREVADGYSHDDKRAMRDGALHMGRGIARVTGSEDLGHAVTSTVGTAVQKTNTLTNMVADGDVAGITSAVARNTSAVVDTGLDSVKSLFGTATLTSEVQKHVGSVNSDRKLDWKFLVNNKNEHLFDIDGNKKVDASELLTMLRNNKIGFDQLDRNHDGSIDYKELQLKLAQISVKNQGHYEKGAMRRAVSNGIEAAEDKAEILADKTRDYAASKTHLGKEIAPMLKDFQQFKFTYDKDHDGKVELHEVVAALKARGITDIKDMDKDGDIDIKDVDAMIRAQNKGAAKPQKGK